MRSEVFEPTGRTYLSGPQGGGPRPAALLTSARSRGAGLEPTRAGEYPISETAARGTNADENTSTRSGTSTRPSSFTRAAEFRMKG